MNTLIAGTIENIVVDVADQFSGLTTLTGKNGEFDVRARSGDSWIIQNQPITNDGMRAFCLIDTNGGAWVAGFYELFLEFDAPPERPRIGPIPFEIAHEMPEGPLSSDIGGVSLNRALYNNPNPAVPSAVYTNLDWGVAVQQGDELLNLTDPLNPKVKVQGVYAFTIEVSAVVTVPPGYPAAWCYCSMTVDPDNFDVSTFDKFSLDLPDPNLLTGMTVCVVSYCPADSVVNFQVFQNAGVPLNFGFEALMQRIT